jgi:hypothetical protein
VPLWLRAKNAIGHSIEQSEGLSERETSLVLPGSPPEKGTGNAWSVLQQDVSIMEAYEDPMLKSQE